MWHGARGGARGASSPPPPAPPSSLSSAHQARSMSSTCASLQLLGPCWQHMQLGGAPRSSYPRVTCVSTLGGGVEPLLEARAQPSRASRKPFRLRSAPCSRQLLRNRCLRVVAPRRSLRRWSSEEVSARRHPSAATTLAPSQQASGRARLNSWRQERAPALCLSRDCRS